MTIRHLNTFIKVCEYMSITKAAQALNIAQPSVTQAIQELENHYGIILFERINQRLVLTQCGKDLLTQAKETINSFNNFEALAKYKELNPSIRIGATLTFGKRFIPTFIKMIKNDFPNVEIYVYIDKTKEIEDRITSGDLDFALTEALITSNNINTIKLKKDRLAIVCGALYDIPDKINFQDITKYPLLLRETGSATRNIIDIKLQEYGLIAKPVMEAIANNAIISMIRNNLGVAILPYILIKEYIDKKILKEIKTDIILERDLYIITHKKKQFTKMQNEIFCKCINYAKSLNIKKE